MGYELLIRPRVGQPPLGEERLRGWLERASQFGLEAGLAASRDPGAPPSPPERPAESTGPPVSWALPNGKATLRARLDLSEGRLRGADLEVPFGGAEEELRGAFDFAIAAARDLDATVFDPQLAREVGREGVEEVVARWRQSQSWVVDVAGAGEDPRSVMEFEPQRPLIGRRNKILLGVILGLWLLYWVFGLVQDSLH